MTFKNRNFTKRNYECTNIVACEADAPPADYFVPCDPAELKGLTHLWTERGVRYFGYL